MNFKKLFEIQAGLDLHIKEQKSLVGKNLVNEKIFAFQVELGELSNELPELFKYWKNSKNDYEKVLEEYVDGLHFLISIGLDLNEKPQYNFRLPKLTDIKKAIMELHHLSRELYIYKEAKHYDYDVLFMRYMELGRLLGFSSTQIEQAYVLKNVENHKRQLNGY